MHVKTFFLRWWSQQISYQHYCRS